MLPMAALGQTKQEWKGSRIEDDLIGYDEMVEQYTAEIADARKDLPQKIDERLTVVGFDFDKEHLMLVTEVEATCSKVEFELLKKVSRKMMEEVYLSEADFDYWVLGARGVGVRMTFKRKGSSDHFTEELTADEIFAYHNTALDALDPAVLEQIVEGNTIEETYTPQEELRAMVEMAKVMLPIELGDGAKIIDLRYENNIFYYVFFDENRHKDVKQMQASLNKKESKQHLLQSLSAEAGLKDNLVAVGATVKFVYKVKGSKDSAEIVILPSELADSKSEIGNVNLQRMAREVNDECPVEINGITLSSCVYSEKDKAFRYTYSINEAMLHQISQQQSVIHAKMLEEVRTNPEMKSMVIQLSNAGGQLEYIYHNPVNYRQVSIVITKEEIDDMVEHYFND